MPLCNLEWQLKMIEEKKKKRRKDFAVAAAGFACAAGLLATAFVITMSGAKKGAHADAGAAAGATSEAASFDWAKIATDKMVAAGFGFATAAFDKDKGVITISGDAPDLDKRNAAFEAGKAAVLAKMAENKLDSKSGVSDFVNAITVAGAAVDASGALAANATANAAGPIPDAAATLSAKPAEEDCQGAYNTLLSGRVINFASGKATISNDSKALLDSLSSVSKKCGAYTVEIGGHTDTKGNKAANQALSERRAQAVADYLVSKGVAASELQIKGYGQSKPLDTSNTKEADAKNRRIEFNVSSKAPAAPTAAPAQ